MLALVVPLLFAITPTLCSPDFDCAQADTQTYQGLYSLVTVNYLYGEGTAVAKSGGLVVGHSNVGNRCSGFDGFKICAIDGTNGRFRYYESGVYKDFADPAIPASVAKLQFHLQERPGPPGRPREVSEGLLRDMRDAWNAKSSKDCNMAAGATAFAALNLAIKARKLNLVEFGLALAGFGVIYKHQWEKCNVWPGW